MDDWDGSLQREGFYWLIRRKGEQHCMGFYSRISGGWRVADSIGRTVAMSSVKTARLYKLGAAVPKPLDLGVVMVADHGYYVPRGIKAEIDRLRAIEQLR